MLQADLMLSSLLSPVYCSASLCTWPAGMPYPQNLQTAHEVEAVVRQHGAVPATIAVLHGVPHVGLTAQQLELIAKTGLAVHKTSRRDLPVVMAKRLHGSTTVSATMLLAARAGIPTFVTGGDVSDAVIATQMSLQATCLTAKCWHRMLASAL